MTDIILSEKENSLIRYMWQYSPRLADEYMPFYRNCIEKDSGFEMYVLNDDGKFSFDQSERRILVEYKDLKVAEFEMQFIENHQILLYAFDGYHRDNTRHDLEKIWKFFIDKIEIKISEFQMKEKEQKLKLDKTLDEFIEKIG
jgi:hypothetical protein